MLKYEKEMDFQSALNLMLHGRWVSPLVHVQTPCAFTIHGGLIYCAEFKYRNCYVRKQISTEMILGQWVEETLNYQPIF